MSSPDVIRLVITSAAAIAGIVLLGVFVLTLYKVLSGKLTLSTQHGALLSFLLPTSVALLLFSFFNELALEIGTNKLVMNKQRAVNEISTAKESALDEIKILEERVNTQLKETEKRIAALEGRAQDIADQMDKIKTDLTATIATLDITSRLAKGTHSELYGLLRYSAGLVPIEQRLPTDINMAITEIRGVGLGTNLSAHITAEARRVQLRNDVNSQILVAYTLDMAQPNGLFRASERLETLLTQHPDRERDIRLAIGRLYESQGYLDKAVEEFTKVLEGLPTCDEALLCMAEAHNRVHDHAAAANCYAQLYRLRPADARLLNRLYAVCDNSLHKSGDALIRELFSPEEVSSWEKTRDNWMVAQGKPHE